MGLILNQVLLAAGLMEGLKEGIIGTLIYTAIGVVMCVIAYFVVDLLIPGKMGKQIAEEKNMPIAIVAAGMILGICVVIAASIAG